MSSLELKIMTKMYTSFQWVFVLCPLTGMATGITVERLMS